MKYTKIKDIRVKFDELFNLEPVGIIDPNYTQYTSQPFFDAEDCNADIKEFLDKVFQDLAIDYSVTFTNEHNHVLYIEGVKFYIEVKRKSITFYTESKDFSFHKYRDRFYSIHLGQTLSTYKALVAFLEIIKEQKTAEKAEQDIKSKIEEFKEDIIFKYKWKEDSYNFENVFVIRYIPLNINILCKFINGCFDFVSYLHHEGETYYSGSEKLSIEEIKSEINYYQSLLDHESIIREKLLSL